MKKILCFILAIVSVLAFASCNSAAPDNSGSETASDAGVAEAKTYKEYLAADVGTPVTVETYVQAKQIWQEGKASLYTQSEEGAYFIYQMLCTEDEYEKLDTGTKIRVYGKKSEWSGEIEITDADFKILDGSFIAKALDVTELAGSAELSDHQNELVKFSGMTVEPKTDKSGNEAAFLYGWDGSGEDGGDLYFDASIGGNKITFTVESDLCGADTEVYKAVKALKVGDVINATGFLYWYDGANPHITDISVQYGETA